MTGVSEMLSLLFCIVGNLHEQPHHAINLDLPLNDVSL